MQEIINSLPKYRVQEINKRVSESQYHRATSEEVEDRRQSARDRSRGHSAARGTKGQRHKSNEKGVRKNEKPQQEVDQQELAQISQQDQG